MDPPPGLAAPRAPLYGHPMAGGVSLTALSSAPAGWLMWQRAASAPVLTVVCRATFVLRPGETALAPEQEPLVAAERAYPDGSSHGLYAPCDLVPMKPRADVVLVGQAFSPGRQPARSVRVRLVVGEIDKTVEVHAGRQFDLQGALHEGQRFTSMPLTYERGAGGPDGPNPIGARPDGRDTYGRITVPNLQPPGLEIATQSDSIPPIGFGPIAAGWPGRASLLGAGVRAPAEWHGQTVPAELDPAFFQAAPRDQQAPGLREDERIALYNLNVQHAELVTRLPGMYPRTFVERGAGGPRNVAMRADTLWIDTAREICTLTWRGQIPLDPPGPAVRVLTALEKAGRPFTWEDLERLAAVTAAGKEGTQALTSTVTMPDVRRRGHNPTLPFTITPPTAPRGPAAAGGLPFRQAGAPGQAPPSAPPPPNSGDTVDEAVPPAPVPMAASMPMMPMAAPMPAPVPMAAPMPIMPMAAPMPAPVPAPVATPAAVDSPWARAGAAGVPLVATAPPVTIGETSSAEAHPAAIARPPSVVPAAAAPAYRAPVEVLQLLWFEAESLPLARKEARFASVLEALDGQPLDQDLDDPSLADDPAAVEDRREAFEILARGPAVDEEGATAALAAAVREDGRILPPIVLLAGEVFLPFGEVETLKAVMSVAAPRAGTDAEARALLELTRDFLGTPGLAGAAAVAEALAGRLRDTFEKRGLVAPGYFDAQVERALLGGRHFQRRIVFGGPHVRALFQTGGGEGGIPVYLGEELSARLPAAQRFRARILAHAHPGIDQHETHPVALRAAALAVATPPPTRR